MKGIPKHNFKIVYLTIPKTVYIRTQNKSNIGEAKLTFHKKNILLEIFYA